MDRTDRRILALLQEDATLPVAELARRVQLSQTPCWKRLQKLKASGVIRKQVALCDPGKLGLGTTVFVAVRTSQHNDAWLRKFDAAVKTIPEIVEVYRMSGEVDYLLRVVTSDIAGYDAVYRRLIKAVELSDVSSSFAMETIKSTTALPLA
jgi:Lrp/AsnC family transcriptional regulator